MSLDNRRDRPDPYVRNNVEEYKYNPLPVLIFIVIRIYCFWRGSVLELALPTSLDSFLRDNKAAVSFFNKICTWIYKSCILTCKHR